MLSEKILELWSWRNSLSDCEQEYIAQVLEKLPEDSRIVIYLRYWRDIEFKDIAEVLGVRLKEVESIHHMTLLLLAKVFSQKLNEQKHFFREVTA